MTLNDIANMTEDFLTPAQVADALGLHPQSIRAQAQEDASRLGFPVIVCGTRALIPREGFLRWCGHDAK